MIWIAVAILALIIFWMLSLMFPDGDWPYVLINWTLSLLLIVGAIGGVAFLVSVVT